MATKQDILNKILENLQMASADIEGISVITPDGMTIANRFHLQGNDATATGAMGAAMSGLGSRVSRTLNIGQMEEINMRSEKANILVLVIENRAALMVQVSNQANMGLILMEARKAKETLSRIL